MVFFGINYIWLYLYISYTFLEENNTTVIGKEK